MGHRHIPTYRMVYAVLRFSGLNEQAPYWRSSETMDKIFFRTSSTVPSDFIESTGNMFKSIRKRWKWKFVLDVVLWYGGTGRYSAWWHRWTRSRSCSRKPTERPKTLSRLVSDRVDHLPSSRWTVTPKWRTRTATSDWCIDQRTRGSSNRSKWQHIIWWWLINQL